MKPIIAALACAFLIASTGAGHAQTTTTPPTKMEKSKKSPSSPNAAVDCKKAENSKNKTCMDAAKAQTAHKAKRSVPKTN